MRLLILFFMSVSIISCGGPHSPSDGDQANGGDINTTNEFNLDVVIYKRGGYGRRDIKARCRGIDGCLQVCGHLSGPPCKKFSADQVIEMWLKEIKSYDAEQAMKDLALIATEPKVADLLKSLDIENKVVQSLFALTQSAHCPFSNGQNISYSREPHANLFVSPIFNENHPLVVAQTEAQQNLDESTALKSEKEEELNALKVEKEEIEQENDTVSAQISSVQTAAESAVQAEEQAQQVFDDAVQAEEQAQSSLDAAEDGNKEAAQAVLNEAQEAKAEAETALNTAKAANQQAKSDLEIAKETKEQLQRLLEDINSSIDAAESSVASLSSSKDTDQAALQNAIHVLAEAQRAAEEEEQRKKVIDGSVLTFNLPVFGGFIKQCFGYSPQAKTFSQVAVEIGNQSAFDIGYQVIFKACGGNDQCVRLAYCTIDSEMVWSYVQTEIKDIGCQYDDFEAIP